jgi:ADP-ribose pyrophosphatase YjhB (NUDIX family)
MITCTFEDNGHGKLRHATVDCIVVKDGQILLAKRSEKLVEGGKWCIPGGYVERNETTTEAAAREVLEETGWQVSNIRLLCVNDSPNRTGDDRQNIGFVYIGDAAKQTGSKDWESTEVQWFPLATLPAPEQIAFDHGDYIKLYKQYLEKPFALPVLMPTD